MIPEPRLHLLQCVLHFFCLSPVRCVWVVVYVGSNNGERAAVDCLHASCIAGIAGWGPGWQRRFATAAIGVDVCGSSILV